jgi:hypothetical protein
MAMAPSMMVESRSPATLDLADGHVDRAKRSHPPGRSNIAQIEPQPKPSNRNRHASAPLSMAGAQWTDPQVEWEHGIRPR